MSLLVVRCGVVIHSFPGGIVMVWNLVVSWLSVFCTLGLCTGRLRNASVSLGCRVVRWCIDLLVVR